MPDCQHLLLSVQPWQAVATPGDASQGRALRWWLEGKWGPGWLPALACLTCLHGHDASSLTGAAAGRLIEGWAPRALLPRLHGL